MGAQHTPGPWSPGHMANNAHPCNCATIFSETCLGGVATVHVGNGMPISDGGNDCPALPEAQANARLIAAAPELADVLYRLLNDDCPNRQHVNGHPIADYARAVLAKATGETL